MPRKLFTFREFFSLEMEKNHYLKSKEILGFDQLINKTMLGNEYTRKISFLYYLKKIKIGFLLSHRHVSRIRVALR